MDLRHILLTTDLSKDALRAFEPVLSLARQTRAKVSILHVVQDLQATPHGAPFAPAQSSPSLPRDIEKARVKLEEICAPLTEGLDVSLHVIGHADPVLGIVHFARDCGADLIALSTHGRTGFRRLALGSVAEEVLRKSPIPVLSFHRPEE